jgi:hypothetical protein
MVSREAKSGLWARRFPKALQEPGMRFVQSPETP